MKENTIKENINNNQINKFNLPTTWTKKKMASLLLMTLLNAYQVNGGGNLKECIGYNSIYSQYDTVVKFANNIADKQLFCCNVPIGSTDVGCSPLSSECPYYFYFMGQCNSVGQSKFCITKGPYLQSALTQPSIQLPSDLCGGILGNTSPTNVTVGECPNSSAISNTLVNQRTAETFSWLCCGKDTCKVPANVKISDSSAITGCSSNEWSLMCFNDNGGWSCTGNVSPNIQNITLPIGSCVEQVIFSGNEITTTGSSSSSGGTKPTASATPSTSPQPENGDGLSTSDKIALGTGVGLGAPSLLLTAWGSWIAYKQYKKKKEKERNVQQGTELNTFGEGSSRTNNEIRQPQYQAQIETNPYYNPYYGQGWRS